MSNDPKQDLDFNVVEDQLKSFAPETIETLKKHVDSHAKKHAETRKSKEADLGAMGSNEFVNYVRKTYGYYPG